MVDHQWQREIVKPNTLIAKDQVELYKHLTKKPKKKKGLSLVGDGISSLEYAMREVGAAAARAGLSTHEAAAALGEANRQAAERHLRNMLDRQLFFGSSNTPRLRHSVVDNNALLWLGERSFVCYIESIESEPIETTSSSDAWRTFMPGPISIRGRLQIPSDSTQSNVLFKAITEMDELFDLHYPFQGSLMRTQGYIVESAIEGSIDRPMDIRFTLRPSGETTITSM